MSLRFMSLLAVLGFVAAASALAIDVQPQHNAFTALKARAVKASKDQSFNIGGVYQWDRQLLTKTVYKSSTILIVHKEKLDFSSTASIHCIQVVDLNKDGKNAAVTVQKGGVGQKSVSLQFKSERGGEINYAVIIWGQ